MNCVCAQTETYPLTTGEDEVWRAKQDVRKGLQQAKIDQVGEESNPYHKHREPLKQIQSRQYTCRELERQHTHKRQTKNLLFKYRMTTWPPHCWQAANK